MYWSIWRLTAVEFNGVYFYFCGSIYIVLFLALTPSVSFWFFIPFRVAEAYGLVFQD